MNSFLAVLKKDLQRNWILMLAAALTWAACLATALFYEANPEQPLRISLLTVGIIARFVLVVVVAVVVVQTDLIMVDRAAWRTRPIGRTTLLLSKVVALTLGLVVPSVLLDTLARLLLREIADASGAVPEPAVVRHVRPLLGAIEHVVRAGQRQGIFEPVDPVHLASTIAGATVFFVAATPLLGKDWPFDPLSKDQLATHRSEVLRITRRLLGAARLRQAKRPSTGR